MWTCTIKGTVRPDWIYMRVVPLDRPWKGHQPLQVFDFFNFTHLIEKTSKFWAASCKNESNLLLVRIMVCRESCLPIGWCTFIWWKNPPKCCSVLVWIAGCWNSLLTSRNPKNNWCLSRILEHGSVEKIAIWAHSNRDPNKQKVGFIFAWSGSELWTLKQYSRSKIKNQKPIAVDVLFKAYPMVPPLMQIQFCRMVTLKK